MSASILGVFYPGEWVVLTDDDEQYTLGRITSAFDSIMASESETLCYSVFNIREEDIEIHPHNRIISLASLKPEGFPFKGHPSYKNFEILLEQITEYAEQIALFSSNFPPVPLITLGAPIRETCKNIRDFRAAAYLQSRVIRAVVEPRISTQCVLPKAIEDSPEQVFASFANIFETSFVGKIYKKNLYRLLTPANLITVQQQNGVHPQHESQQPEKFSDSIDNYKNDYERALDLVSFVENTKEFTKMRKIAEESSFQLGDAIRINVGGENIIILVIRIWAAETKDLPKVFVDGEILLKLEDSYALSGIKATFPLSDPAFAKEVERAPVVFVVESETGVFHVPARLAGDGEIEYAQCCEFEEKEFKMNEEFETVEGDEEGFAIGERINEPLHIQFRLIAMDEIELATMEAHLLGVIKRLKYVVYEIKNDLGVQKLFESINCYIRPLTVAFLEEPTDLLPNTIIEEQEEKETYLISENGKLSLVHTFSKMLCNHCNDEIPSSLFTIDSNFSKEAKDISYERLFIESLSLNAIGGCYHCPCCESQYHPECFVNEESKFEKFINHLCDFEYGLVSINSPCENCLQEWINEEPYVSLNHEDPMHEFVNAEINFLSYSFDLESLSENQFDDLAAIICENTGENIFNVNSISNYLFNAFKTIINNWHISTEFEKCIVVTNKTECINFFENEDIKKLSQLFLNFLGEEVDLGIFYSEQYETLEINSSFRFMPTMSNELMANFYVEAEKRVNYLEPNLIFAGAPLYSEQCLLKFEEEKERIKHFLVTNTYKEHSFENQEPTKDELQNKEDKEIDEISSEEDEIISSKKKSKHQKQVSAKETDSKEVIIKKGEKAIELENFESLKSANVKFTEEPIEEIDTERQVQLTELLHKETASVFESQEEEIPENFESKKTSLVTLFEDLFTEFIEKTGTLELPSNNTHGFFTGQMVEKYKDLLRPGPLELDGIKDTLATVQLADPQEPCETEAEQLLLDVLFDAPITPEILSEIVHERIKRLRVPAASTQTEHAIQLLGAGVYDFDSAAQLVALLKQLQGLLGGAEPREPNSLYRFPKSVLVQRAVLEAKRNELETAREELQRRELAARTAAERTISEVECVRGAIIQLKERLETLVDRLIKEEKEKGMAERALQLNGIALTDLERSLQNVVSGGNEGAAASYDQFYIREKLEEIVSSLETQIGQ